jgi:hypothetical protein
MFTSLAVPVDSAAIRARVPAADQQRDASDDHQPGR